MGPPGFQGLLDSMAIFTNKKYPEQCVIEVGRADGIGDHRKDVTIELEYMTILVRPIFVSQVWLHQLVLFLISLLLAGVFAGFSH